MFYSGKGDDGQSELFGNGNRCNKNEPIFDALGTVDELNALLGVCYAKADTGLVQNRISIPDTLRSLQEDLFVVQAELAGSDKKISGTQVERLEDCIKTLAEYTPKPNSFVIAGSSELSAYLDFARTVARRTERVVLGVPGDQSVSEETTAYLNRLSSVLYVLARFVASLADEKEQHPSYDTK